MFAVCQVAINLTRNRLTHPQSSFMTRDMEARDGKQGVRAPSRSPAARRLRGTGRAREIG